MQQNTELKLKELRALMLNLGIDGFIQPSNDMFLSEYTPEYDQRLAWLTGFTGSNGLVLLLAERAIFFTDNRYILQAKQQIDLNHYEILNIKDYQIWMQQHCINEKIAYDPRLHSIKWVKYFTMQVKNNNFITIEENLIDQIWRDKPQKPLSDIFLYDHQFAGKDKLAKIQKILQELKQTNNFAAQDVYLLSSPESICWLLNIRAHDILYNPLLLSYAFIHPGGNIDLFADITENQAIKQYLARGITIRKLNELEAYIKAIEVDSVACDYSKTTYWFYQQFKASKLIIKDVKDPCDLAKACKNKIEVAQAKKIHLQDGAAICKWLYWFEQQDKSKLRETDIADKLLKFRQQHSNFLYPSFATIAGFKQNGAIIHYNPAKGANDFLHGEGLLLVDSGGQYLGGTTDVTRTICIGSPNDEVKEMYTRVLKGHIAIARAKFPLGTCGSQLDILARYYLWQIGADYGHSTGHGVGNCLSVHEGPQRISSYTPGEVKLMPGMILSNEPGFYQEGGYGIRIENLVVVQESSFSGFLELQTITQVPFEIKLIDFKLLDDDELLWIKSYHQQIYHNLADYLTMEERKFLLQFQHNTIV